MGDFRTGLNSLMFFFCNSRGLNNGMVMEKGGGETSSDGDGKGGEGTGEEGSTGTSFFCSFFMASAAASKQHKEVTLTFGTKLKRLGLRSNDLTSQ